VTAPVVFVDTETTGLDPDRHEIWEVGLIEADGTEHHWFLPVDLGSADPVALKIGRFHDRHPHGYHAPHDEVDDEPHVTNRRTFAYDFARLTAGCHLVGAVVSFDEERLRKLLRANGACPDWHYHLVDVESLAAGWLARNFTRDAISPEPPWNSRDMTTALGVTVDESEKHTALGDARWAAAIYEAVMGS
jgi:DNA polymerase III epsilon subunit-like protein